jgi:hypothetical protein
MRVTEGAKWVTLELLDLFEKHHRSPPVLFTQTWPGIYIGISCLLCDGVRTHQTARQQTRRQRKPTCDRRCEDVRANHGSIPSLEPGSGDDHIPPLPARRTHKASRKTDTSRVCGRSKPEHNDADKPFPCYIRLGKHRAYPVLSAAGLRPGETRSLVPCGGPWLSCRCFGRAIMTAVGSLPGRKDRRTHRRALGPAAPAGATRDRRCHQSGSETLPKAFAISSKASALFRQSLLSGHRAERAP